MGKWLLKFALGITRSATTSAAFLTFLVLGGTAFAGCTLNAVDLRWDGGNARFKIEIADDDQERAQGLMFRRSMPKYAGMLFVYRSPQPVGFWMRNTEIPLDMLFFGEDGTSKKLHENAIPHDETVIDGGPDIQYILEINGGLINSLGIKEPVMFRHELLDQSLADWPCE